MLVYYWSYMWNTWCLRKSSKDLEINVPPTRKHLLPPESFWLNDFALCIMTLAISGTLWMGCVHVIFSRTIPNFPLVELDLYNRMRAHKVLQKAQIIGKSFKVTAWPSEVLQKADHLYVFQSRWMAFRSVPESRSFVSLLKSLYGLQKDFLLGVVLPAQQVRSWIITRWKGRSKKWRLKFPLEGHAPVQPAKLFPSPSGSNKGKEKYFCTLWVELLSEGNK